MTGEERTGFSARHPRVFLAAVLLIFLCAFLVRMHRSTRRRGISGR